MATTIILKQLLTVLIALSTLLSASHTKHLGAACTSHSIYSSVISASKEQRANMKIDEIVFCSKLGTFIDTTYGNTIEIRSISKKDNQLEIYARAWKGAQPLGFGTDATIEWQRFLIQNPPILVPDPAGTITRSEIVGGITNIRTLREDHMAALQNVLAEAVNFGGRTSNRIITGSEGHTISTFFPDAGSPGTNSADAMVQRNATNESWATIQAGAGTDVNQLTADNEGVSFQAGTTAFNNLTRSIFTFDTSSITSGSTIASSTMSLNGDAKRDNNGACPCSINIYAATPASNTSIAAADFTQIGSTALSSDITYTNYVTTGYNHFVQNATGRNNITTGGVTRIGAREVTFDVGNTAPARVNGAVTGFQFLFADQAGTSQDPQLLVDWTAPVAAAAVNNEIIFYE